MTLQKDAQSQQAANSGFGATAIPDLMSTTEFHTVWCGAPLPLKMCFDFFFLFTFIV